MRTALERYVSTPCLYGESGVGWLGPDHCGSCMLEVAADIRAFHADVQAGKYDAEGYTPRERAALAKKRRAA